MIATHAWEIAARIRSYELVAQVFDMSESNVRAVPDPV